MVDPAAPHRTRRHTPWRSAASVLLCALAAVLSVAPAGAEPGPERVPVDMTTWYRRDWDDCESATRIELQGSTLRIKSEQSTGLFWQVPTVDGRSLELDPEEHTWLKDCKRPPRSFNSDIQKEGLDAFIDISEYRYVTWRWKVDYAETGKQKVKPGDKLDKKYDDFPAKFGISMLKRGSNDIREVAYVWSASLPENLMFKSETTIIPFVWKLEWRRVVAQSGLDRTGEWIWETRDLYQDYKLGYDGEEPGKILRIYLMTDSDNMEGRAATWYGDIVFHKERPGP